MDTNAVLTSKVAAMTEDERLARGDELLAKGKLSPEENLKFVKILLGPNMRFTNKPLQRW